MEQRFLIEKEGILDIECWEIEQAIKGLRQDLQAQPIMVNVDGKVVSRISRVQSRQSVSKNGYGG